MPGPCPCVFISGSCARLWAAAPFAAGPLLAAALHPHVRARGTTSVALWAVWGLVLLATLVPCPLSLTVIRSVAPATVVAIACAAAAAHDRTAPATIAVALVWTVTVTVEAFLPATAMVQVNGPAYPNERRYPLAVPSSVLVGPLELAWAAVVGLPSAAVLLLAAHQWIAGGVVALLAASAVVFGGRALNGLSRRWVVFVPAGLVLHDAMSLSDAVLFPRKVIECLGPAPAGTDALDLTLASPGLALELSLKEKVPMVRIVPGQRKGDAGSSARLMFTPTRPGAVLADARARHFPVL